MKDLKFFNLIIYFQPNTNYFRIIQTWDLQLVKIDKLIIWENSYILIKENTEGNTFIIKEKTENVQEWTLENWRVNIKNTLITKLNILLNFIWQS